MDMADTGRKSTNMDRIKLAEYLKMEGALPDTPIANSETARAYNELYKQIADYYDVPVQEVEQVTIRGTDYIKVNGVFMGRTKMKHGYDMDDVIKNKYTVIIDFIADPDLIMHPPIFIHFED